MNKAGYTPVMLAALTAAESPDDLEVAQQLLKQGDVNARSRQVLSRRAHAFIQIAEHHRVSEELLLAPVRRLRARCGE